MGLGALFFIADFKEDELMKSSIQIALTAFGGWLGWVLGGWDGFLYALITFVVIDYLTGVMLAVLEKRLSSEVGARGIFKKVLIFALVAVGHIIDTQVIANGSAVRTAVIFFYLSNEGISILENAAKIGLPIPEKLKLVLDQLNKEETING
jgi:toxin secretion/phage lysis holin